MINSIGRKAKFISCQCTTRVPLHHINKIYYFIFRLFFHHFSLSFSFSFLFLLIFFSSNHDSLIFFSSSFRLLPILTLFFLYQLAISLQTNTIATSLDTGDNLHLRPMNHRPALNFWLENFHPNSPSSSVSHLNRACHPPVQPSKLQAEPGLSFWHFSNSHLLQ